MPGFGKVYNIDPLIGINRFWITNFAHVFSQVLMGITSTVLSPRTAVRSSVRQFSEALSAGTGRVFDSAKGAVKRVFISTGLVVAILWVSAFLHVCFYRFYVPTASLVRPAHFQFRVCPDGSGICSFPSANITLCDPNCVEAIGTGQQYRVILQLLIPDSVSNRDAGMFMVHGKMYDQHGSTVQESSRSVAVKYQSDVLKFIQTVILSPLYFTDLVEETQTLAIELFEDFRDDYYQPTTRMLLEIHSHHLTFYSAQLQFHACYTGLKYYLFYYPVSSAVCSIAFNCVWLAAVFLLKWYKVGLALLDSWVRRIALSTQDGDAIEGPEARPCENGACLPEAEEEVETVKNYIQPFTVITSSKAHETAENIRDSTPDRPMTEANSSHQQGKPPTSRSSHIQPFTIIVAAAKETEQRQAEETRVKKPLKEEDSVSENGELRPRKKWFKY